jgi:ribosome-interacting GTPase 1
LRLLFPITDTLGRYQFLHSNSKLARLRAQLLEPAPGAGSGGGAGFDVSKSGDARIALVGFPSVGKSTFLSKITKTKSEVAAYSFTTLTAIPGVLEYGGAEIQILDLPGIIEGASEGKGRGRQVISAAKVGRLKQVLVNGQDRPNSYLTRYSPTPVLTNVVDWPFCIMLPASVCVKYPC